MTEDQSRGDFCYRGGELCCEGVPVRELAAAHGTPLYVYSAATITARYTALRDAFGPAARICYAVKANSNLALLTLLAELGAGFDLVSGGELERVRRAGLDLTDAVFAGVGKEEWEIRAALEADILFVVVESLFELPVIERVAAGLGRPARLALRLNPDVAAGGHDYISTGRSDDKFGLAPADAVAAAERIAGSPHLSLVGLHVHLGSQLHEVEPYLEAFAVVERFLDQLPPEVRRAVRYYDLGGGFGIGAGAGERPLDLPVLAAALLPRLAARGLTPVLEPGRYLVADAGVLVARVLGIKRGPQLTFAVVDAAMNDLIRPALYSAEHAIRPVRQPAAATPRVRYDVVGPVCESGDFLARDRELPELGEGDLLSVFTVGAYGMSMASSYNSRRRPAEVLVRGTSSRLVRRRDRFEDLWRGEVEL